MTSTTESQLYQQTINQGKKSFQCLVSGCGKIYKFKSDIERHIIVHSNQKSCVCTYPGCNKSFKRPDALKNHIQTHQEESTFVCPIPDCHATFHKKDILQYHLVKHQMLQNYISNPSNNVQEQTQQGSRPFKRVQQWEKEWCAQQKNTQVQSPKQIQDHYSVKYSDDETEISSVYGEEPALSKVFIGESGVSQSQNFLSSPSRTFSDETVSEASFPDVSEYTSPDASAADFLKTLCNQLAQQNHELKRQLSDKIDLLQVKYENVDVPAFFESDAFDFISYNNQDASAFPVLFD